MNFKKEYFDFVTELTDEQITALNLFRIKYKDLCKDVFELENVTDDMKERALEHLLISLNLLNNGICKNNL